MDKAICVGTVLLVIITVVLVLRRKGGGLASRHHAELNKPKVPRSRFNKLRHRYSGNQVAQQQIDVYDGNTEYHSHLRSLSQAFKSGNTATENRETKWLEDNYPDV